MSAHSMAAPDNGRRGLLGASLAVLAGGIVGTGAQAIPAPSDMANSPLLAACAEYTRMDDYIRRFDEGLLDVDDDTFCLVWAPHHAVVDRIASITARTHEERIAKAKAALSVMRWVEELDSKAYNDLVRSALRDVVAGGAA